MSSQKKKRRIENIGVEGVEGVEKIGGGGVEKVYCGCNSTCSLVHPKTKKRHQGMQSTGFAGRFEQSPTICCCTDLLELGRTIEQEDWFAEDFRPDSPSEEIVTKNPELHNQNIHLKELLRQVSELVRVQEEDSFADSDSDSENSDSESVLPLPDPEEDLQEVLCLETGNEDVTEEEDKRKSEIGKRKYPPGKELERLYDGASLSILSAVSVLFTWKQDSQLSDIWFGALLHILATRLLPKENQLPKTLYLAERILETQNEGTVRDICLKECHLFAAGEKTCPVCEESRYVTEGPRKGLSQRSFTSFSVVDQLRTLLQEEAFLEGLKAMTTFLETNPSAEQTIWAGKLFAPFRAPGMILNNLEEGFALSIGMDGAPTFVTGTGDIWAISLKIWNLPAKMRTEEKYRLFFCVVESKFGVLLV